MSSNLLVRITPIFLILSFLHKSGAAQVPAHHMTPGLPWTVVDESELPPEAIDSATYNSLVDFVNQSDELRYLFRVYFHPELTEIVDGKISAELPRDPGVSEVVHWNRGRIDSSQLDGQGQEDYIRYRGNDSSHPSLSPFSIFMLTYVIVSDTSLVSYPEDYFGTIQFGPAYYALFGGPTGTGAHRYGYFIQTVDSIYHPQVSSVREKISSIQLHAFPNPCRNNFTINVPSIFSQRTSVLTLIEKSTNRVVYQTQNFTGNETIELKEGILGALMSGNYLAFIRREDGVGGVAFVNFVKQ